MKKSIYYGAAISLGLASIFASNTFATGNHLITTEDQLRSCLTEVTDYNVCKLQNDIALTKSIILPDGAKDARLDLLGRNIYTDSSFTGSKNTGIIIVNHGASLTVTGSGTITTEDTKGTQDTTDDVDTGVYAAIAMTATDDISDTSPAKLKIKNNATLRGKYYGIVGNGSEGRGNTEINIISGTIKGLTKNDSVGIYHPQAGTLTIEDGVLEGNNGLYIKSGTVNINGGTIRGLDDAHAYQFNASAAITTGDAIVLENAEYPGGAPTLNIAGGTFTSENNKSLGVYVKTEGTTPAPTAEITGGTFKEAPSAEDIPSGYAVFEEEDTEGNKTYTVKKLADLSALDALLTTIENDEDFAYEETYGDEDLPTKIADLLREAKIIVTSENAYDESKQEEIDNLTDDLEDAYDTQKANNTALIEYAIEVTIKYMEFLAENETQYTEESLARVDEAYQAMVNFLDILAEADTSAEDYSEEIKTKSLALSDAIDALEKIPEVTTPDSGAFTVATSTQSSLTALLASAFIVALVLILPRLKAKKAVEKDQ